MPRTTANTRARAAVLIVGYHINVHSYLSLVCFLRGVKTRWLAWKGGLHDVSALIIIAARLFAELRLAAPQNPLERSNRKLDKAARVQTIKHGARSLPEII